jgi:hypothetical protein
VPDAIDGEFSGCLVDDLAAMREEQDGLISRDGALDTCACDYRFSAARGRYEQDAVVTGREGGFDTLDRDLLKLVENNAGIAIAFVGLRKYTH